jgi:hypothetical protein
MGNTTTLDVVLDGLMRRYRDRVPDVGTIVGAMISDGLIDRPSSIENDHIAFRTMGIPYLGIRSFERIFVHLGYIPEDSYHFAAKKLEARWYGPPEPRFPRIFVSELRVGDLSAEAQAVVTSYTGEVRRDPVDSLDLDDGNAVDTFLHQPLWRLPLWEDYQRLSMESEYGAWVIYNRYYLNHFTISVHNLPSGFDTIAEFNHYVERLGIKLNDAGGKVKVSSDGGLIQSSTVAAPILARFAGGDEHAISCSYVEFAERRILPQFCDLPRSSILRTHRRDGFEVGNADKIFESTYSRQVRRANLEGAEERNHNSAG